MSTAVNPTDEPTTADAAVTHDQSHEPSDAPTRAELDQRNVVRRQRERFVGMKFGACFFGWLTATGFAVLLTALLAGAGAAVGAEQNLSADQAGGAARTTGIVGGLVLLVVVLLAYVCGGYVAGRMARFNGLRQGLGVWLWAIVVAVVAGVLTVAAGARFTLLSNLNGLPAIPVDRSDLTTGSIVVAVAVLVVSLVGALLGGLAGMRYHRRVDHADLTTELGR